MEFNKEARTMKTFFKNNSFLCLSVILAVITGFSIFMVPKIGAQGSWRLPVPCCLTAGSLMVAVDGNNIKPLDAVATGQVLISAGTGTIPAWSTTLPLSAQVHTATATLTAADCGKVHFLSHASTAIILTLPAPALGCQMKFVTALAFSDQHEVRTPASANIIEGTLLTLWRYTKTPHALLHSARLKS